MHPRTHPPTHINTHARTYARTPAYTHTPSAHSLSTKTKESHKTKARHFLSAIKHAVSQRHRRQPTPGSLSTSNTQSLNVIVVNPHQGASQHQTCSLSTSSSSTHTRQPLNIKHAVSQRHRRPPTPDSLSTSSTRSLNVIVVNPHQTASQRQTPGI